MRHRFVHRAGTLALTLLMVALSTLMVGASGDRAKAEKASSLPEKEAVKTGVTVYSNAKASIDASNLSEGYLIVKYTGGKSVRIKVQITKSGGTTYTYDLNNAGTTETFPLTEGDGKMCIRDSSKMADLISSKKLMLNGRECDKPDRPVGEGDVLVCRGLGKCVLSTISGPSKKGRIMIVIERYI